MYNTSKRNHFYGAVALTISALTASPVAVIAETEDPEARQDVIVVEGHQNTLGLGAPASFLETPLSTTTIEAEQLLAQGSVTLLEGLRNVPGVQADMTFVGSHSQVFVLRGAIADNGTQASRILRDGTRLTNYGYTPAFIEKLNVLRGPGAAAAIRSEPGGTVEVITKSAQMSNFGEAFVRGGENNAQEYWLDVNRVLSEEHELAVRGVLVRSVADEWRGVPDELDGLKLNIAKSGANLYRIEFDFEATNNTYQPDFGLPGMNGRPADVPLDLQLSEPFADSETNNRIYTLSGEFNLSETTQLAARYTHMDSETVSIRNSIFREIGGPVGTFMRVTAYEPDGDRDIDSFSLSLTSEVEFGGLSHNLFVGAEYFQETLDLIRLTVPSSNNPPINIYNPVFGLTTAPTGDLASSLTIQDSEAFLLSVQDRIEIGKFNLVIGAQFVDETSVHGTVDTIPSDESRISPKLGLTYALLPNQTLFASYTTGTSPQYVATATNESVPMRRSEQIEAGWKGEFLNGGLQAELVAFRLDQERTLTPDPVVSRTFLVNGGMRSQGVEAAVSGAATDRLTLGLAYAYTDTEFRENSLFPGSQTPNVPYHSGNIWAQMEWDQHWRTSVNVYAQGDRYADLANTTVMPGYITTDLSQAYAFELAGHEVEFQLNIKNLFDEEYYSGSHLHVSRYIMPGQPRTVSASLRCAF